MFSCFYGETANIYKNENDEFNRCACRLQESEVVYCGRLSLVADLLQGLFKEAYTLQKGLLELLDRVSLDSSASEEQVSDIVTGVCLCMHLPFFHCHPLVINPFHCCTFTPSLHS